ncbi:hypothetical protein P3339_08965 [Microbulbifer sp. MLAF003]|uniref:hypothetical protein n=2 Tax=unclassified Microbulbifer TaxID=2619833 RepID=UPI0024ACB557|nr:hypothetical protein [Microbulbifer sp. MLAF003]WHI52876.1 hypothetical protein P3339_08965 [Microbulbifer sp. MLAF003]
MNSNLKKYIVNPGKLAMLGFIFATGSAYSGTECTGKVTSVEVAANGNVNAGIKDSGNGTNFHSVALCRVTEDIEGGFKQESCKVAFSLLTTAHVTGKNVTLWFDEEKFSSCSQSWGEIWSQGLYHIRLKEN